MPTLPSDEGLVDYRDLEERGLRNRLGERLTKPIPKPNTKIDDAEAKRQNFINLFGTRPVDVPPDVITLFSFETSAIGRDLASLSYVVSGPYLPEPYWFEPTEMFEALTEFDRNARRSAHLKAEEEKRAAAAASSRIVR